LQRWQLRPSQFT